MPNYRRAATPGGTYFFTLVTYQRQKILCSDEIRTALRDAVRTTQAKWPFTIDAWVLMPDHLHAIWTLPAGDAEYSRRWSMIKRLVTKRVGYTNEGSRAHGVPRSKYSWGTPYVSLPNVGCAVRTSLSLSESRKKRREGHLWQRRFWEHDVRDETDLNRCRDYLHWNPVKHGTVSRVADWPYSTFHRFVREGFYPEDWGGGDAIDLDERMFGE